MLVKVGESYEPVFKLEDLRDHMSPEIFEAVESLVQVPISEAEDSAEEYKEMYKDEEKVSDSRYQIINQGIQSLVAMREELKGYQRFNRSQLVDKLNNIIGELENY